MSWHVSLSVSADAVRRRPRAAARALFAPSARPLGPVHMWLRWRLPDSGDNRSAVRLPDSGRGSIRRSGMARPGWRRAGGIASRAGRLFCRYRMLESGTSAVELRKRIHPFMNRT